MKYHTPVMLKESLHYLDPQEGRKYIDGTLGDAGHTLALLKKGGIVLGIDIYESALARAKERIEKEGLLEDFIGRQGNFKEIERIAGEISFSGVHGIIFDLGYSTRQLGKAGIGLSFQKDEPLDMRMDKNLQVTAADLLNTLPEKELIKLMRDYGGEMLASRFAKEIVKFRGLKKFQTTKDLADLLVSVSPSNYERGRINPATRTFQALRIVVNDEIENLEKALPRAARLLLPGGRMVIISFHSLEDKVAKEFGYGVQPNLKSVTKKPLIPGKEEVEKNIRSRSAKMRVYEKQN